MWLNLALIASLTIATPFIAPGQSLCQMFIRQNIQILHGTKFDRFKTGSAHKSYLLWKSSKYALPRGAKLRPGDLVYWKGTSWNRYGHVGIYGYHGQLYENSTVHWRGRYAGKGARVLKHVRPYDLAVRLPDVWAPKTPPGALRLSALPEAKPKYAIREGGETKYPPSTQMLLLLLPQPSAARAVPQSR